jgi:hypothetical protein
VANETFRRAAYLVRPSDGQLLGAVDEFSSGANSAYEGLSTSVQRRLANNVSATANYTWSHCDTTDYGGDTGQTNNVNTSNLNPSNLNYMKGDCSAGAVDQRQIFNLTVAARTPTFSNRAVRLVATGWTLSTIVRYHSGGAITVTDSADNLLTGVGSQRPNLIGNPISPTQGDACANLAPCVSWFTSTAFAVPAANVLGSSSVGEYRGPGFTDVSMSLIRGFQIREKLRMDFRVDAFNVLNAVRLNNPGASISTSTFGEITSDASPRIMQVSAKFVF